MIVPIGDTSIGVDQLGTAGSAVVFLHGLGNCRKDWGKLLDQVAVAHRVYAPDNRGSGDSKTGDHEITVDRMADDVIEVLDTLNVDRFHLVGHSLGGVIAQSLLTRHNDRVKSAVLISTSSRVGEKGTKKWQRLADYVEANGLNTSPKSARRGFTDAFADANPEMMAEFAARTALQTPSAYAAQARAASSYDYTEALTAIDQPALVIQGDADTMTSPGGSVILSRTIPNAKLEMIEGLDHQLHHEMGDEFTERVIAFFAEVDANDA